MKLYKRLPGMRKPAAKRRALAGIWKRWAGFWRRLDAAAPLAMDVRISHFGGS